MKKSTDGLKQFPALRALLRLSSRCGALAVLGLLALGTATAQPAAPTVSAPVERTAFDHLTTGFELIGKHRDLPCESCHVNAIFKGTPRDCASCHGVGTQVRATKKPTSHILTSNRCEGCHTPVAFSPAVNFDHAEVQGSCSSCHNNVQAQGKGPTHIDTNLECNACHSTIGWAGAVFNHAGVTTGCANCHDGLQAKGTPPTHILPPTGGAPCEACHIPTQYTSFSGATMNHPAIGTPPMLCTVCHEAGMSFFGVTIVTRPPAPHATTGDCYLCHTSFTTFKGGTGQPPGHIPTAQPCALCHSNPADYSIYVMMHDGISSGCATCHGPGKSFTNMTPPTLVLPPANHIGYGGAACESCHSNTNFTIPGGFMFSNASGSAPPAMVHSAVSSLRCDSCHASGLTFVGAPPTKVFPATGHVPIGSADCGVCHGTGSFSSFMFTNASGTAAPAMVHSAVSAIVCSTCHEKGLSWLGVPATKLRPPTERRCPPDLGRMLRLPQVDGHLRGRKQLSGQPHPAAQWRVEQLQQLP
jgi:Cytochrome c7 and related cytochrome c